MRPRTSQRQHRLRGDGGDYEGGAAAAGVLLGGEAGPSAQVAPHREDRNRHRRPHRHRPPHHHRTRKGRTDRRRAAPPLPACGTNQQNRTPPGGSLRARGLRPAQQQLLLLQRQRERRRWKHQLQPCIRRESKREAEKRSREGKSSTRLGALAGHQIPLRLEGRQRRVGHKGQGTKKKKKQQSHGKPRVQQHESRSPQAVERETKVALALLQPLRTRLR